MQNKDNTVRATQLLKGDSWKELKELTDKPSVSIQVHINGESIGIRLTDAETKDFLKYDCTASELTEEVMMRYCDGVKFAKRMREIRSEGHSAESLTERICAAIREVFGEIEGDE